MLKKEALGIDTAGLSLRAKIVGKLYGAKRKAPLVCQRDSKTQKIYWEWEGARGDLVDTASTPRVREIVSVTGRLVRSTPEKISFLVIVHK